METAISWYYVLINDKLLFVATMAAQFVLDLRLLVRGCGESHTIVYGITSQAANVFSNVSSTDILPIVNRSAETRLVTIQPPGLEG